MSELLKVLAENDPLKAADELMSSANFRGRKYDREQKVSVSFLLMTSAFLALTKTLYGAAGFNIIQHFVTSIFVVFIGYVSVGILMLLFGIPYPSTNNKIRCFLTCFVASLAVSLFFVYAADGITRAAVSVFEWLPLSGGIIGRLADFAPAFLFSLVGCAAVFWSKRNKLSEEDSRQNEWRYWQLFVIYWVVTGFVFYAVAYDRGWFFDNVMRYTSKIMAS